MSVSDGQRANAENFNNAFMSRTTDTDTTGKVDLKDSGSTDVIDAQLVINTNISDIASNASDIAQLDLDKQDIVEKDTPNGYAGLDGSGKIAASAIPDNFVEFKGVWDASTNTPTLIDGTGTTGDVYRVSVAGTQDLGSGSIDFLVGDWNTYNGTIWQKSDFAGGIDWSDPVDSTLTPDTADTHDIGTAAANFRDAFFNRAFIGEAILAGNPSLQVTAVNGVTVGEHMWNMPMPSGMTANYGINNPNLTFGVGISTEGSGSGGVSPSGNIQLESGNLTGVTNTAGSGDINLRTGDSSSTQPSSGSGDINLNVGTVVSGTRGNINFTGNDADFTGMATADFSGVTVTGLTASALGANIIHNGAMEINQRKGYLGSGTYTSGIQFVVDRFYISEGITNTKNVSYAQVIDATVPDTSGFEFREVLSLTNNASVTVVGTDSFEIFHNIEGPDMRGVLSKTCAFSFWVNSSLTGTYSMAVRNGAGNRSYVDDYTINVANTWERKEFSIDFSGESPANWLLDAGNIGALVNLSLGAGATIETATLGSFQAGNYRQSTSGTDWIATNGATFKAVGFKMEIGASATDFNRAGVTYAEEVSLLKRYYEKSYELATAPAAVTFASCDTLEGSTSSQNSVSIHMTEKVLAPTITFYNPNTGATGTWYSTGLAVSKAVATNVLSSKKIVGAQCTTASLNEFMAGHWTASTGF